MVNDGLRKNINIYNNTIYNNGEYIYYSGGIKIESSNVEDISILNNICSQNIQYQIGVHNDALDEVSVEYNLIDGEQIHEISVYGENYILDSPGFVDTSNMNFHLTENSPAIDEGHPDPQYNDPDGTRNDIGAFYYAQSGVVTRDTFAFFFDPPNVFSSSTVISYSIQRADFVTLKIYDLLGREIGMLVNELQEAGTYSYPYNGTSLAGGIYFFKLQVGNDFSETRKMLLLR